MVIAYTDECGNGYGARTTTGDGWNVSNATMSSYIYADDYGGGFGVDNTRGDGDSGLGDGGGFGGGQYSRT